jgi:hypothetical protein
VRKFKYTPPLALLAAAEIRVNGTVTRIRFTAYADGDFEQDDGVYLEGVNVRRRVGSDVMKANADVLREASVDAYRAHEDRARGEYEAAAENAADEHKDRRLV